MKQLTSQPHSVMGRTILPAGGQPFREVNAIILLPSGASDAPRPMTLAGSLCGDARACSTLLELLDPAKVCVCACTRVCVRACVHA